MLQLNSHREQPAPHQAFVFVYMVTHIAPDSGKTLLSRVDASWSFSLYTISSWASIISLLLTAWVWIDVRNIRKTYLSRARVPEINAKLSKLASEIADGMNDYEQMRGQIAVAAGQTEAFLRSLRSKTSGQAKTQAKACLRLASAYLKNPTEPGIRDLYLGLRKLEATVEEQLQDLKWEG